MTSCLYLIRAGKCIKVGLSQNVARRAKSFQTGNAARCETIFMLRLVNAAEMERELKDRLSPYCERGEWFNVSIRKALRHLHEMRHLFEFDEERELKLPAKRGIGLGDCREQFIEWVRETYPDVEGRISLEEVWQRTKAEFLAARPEIVEQAKEV